MLFVAGKKELQVYGRDGNIITLDPVINHTQEITLVEVLTDNLIITHGNDLELKVWFVKDQKSTLLAHTKLQSNYI